jgi:Fe-S-cluster-containing hydrogenase component 2
MEAMSMKDGVPSVDLARCIGCGLCVPSCPENAMHLVKKAQEIVPPQTEEELFRTILAGKTAQEQAL